MKFWTCLVYRLSWVVNMLRYAWWYGEDQARQDSLKWSDWRNRKRPTAEWRGAYPYLPFEK